MADDHQHQRDAEGRSSFVRSLMEAQRHLEAAQERRGGAAAGGLGSSGAHHVGAEAALEVLDSLSRDRVTHDDDEDETVTDYGDGGGTVTDASRRRSTTTNDLLAQIAAAENANASGARGAGAGLGATQARQVPMHMDSAATASTATGELLARVDDLWGPGTGSSGNNHNGLDAASAVAASDTGPLGGIAPPPPHPDAVRPGGRGGNISGDGGATGTGRSNIGEGYSEAVMRPDTDEQQIREQYRIMALNDARREAARIQEQQQQQAVETTDFVDEDFNDSAGVGRIPRRTPPTRPPPPKPRRGRPPPPPGPIEPPMPLPRKGTASIDDKYTAAWRAVPDLCTGQVVKLRSSRQDNSNGNAPLDRNGGLDLPASVLVDRAMDVGDDEHLVRCLNCTRGLRVHKMASLVRCSVCASVSPATSLR